VQSAVNTLAERFHAIYGPPAVIHVLGGNSMKCHGAVTHATYLVSVQPSRTRLPCHSNHRLSTGL
jgi:hypothetical protein